MPFESLVRTRQINKPEFSGYVVDVLLQYLKTGSITGIAMNTGQLSGQFYPLQSNPSGYITTGNLSGYATQQYVTDADAAVLSYVGGTFYTNTNPSGYITSGQLTGLAEVTGDIQFTGAGGITVTGLNGIIVISGDGTADNLTGYVPWQYFNSGAALSLPYVVFADQSLPGQFIFANSSHEYLLEGYRTGYPSEKYFIDFYGASTGRYGLTYKRPTVFGFDISGGFISSSGYPVLTTKDLTGLASWNQLRITSGQLEDDIWRVRTDLFGAITGTGIYTVLDVGTKVYTGNVLLTGVGGLKVLSGVGNSIFFSGAPSINTGGFVDLGTTQTILGTKNFSGVARFRTIYSPVGKVTISMENRTLQDDAIALNWSGKWLLDNSETVTLDWGNRILSGAWTGNALTISGYPVMVSSGQTFGGGGGVSSIQVSGLSISGAIEVSGQGGIVPRITGNTLIISGGSTIDTGSFITSSQTGAFVDIGTDQTILGEKSFSGIVRTYGIVDIFDTIGYGAAQLRERQLFNTNEEMVLDWGIHALSGVWGAQDLLVSGSPVLTRSQTGAFASNINLQTISGRVNSVSGTTQALSGQTQGLQSQITTINSKTGVFITTAQTGQFYAANNPDGFITAAQVSGTGVTYVGGLTASVGVVGGGNVSISTGTPNNLIISGATGAFASNVNLQTVSGSVAAINAKTGTFITSAQTGRFVDTGSNQTISGIKTFRGGVYTYGNVDIRDSNSLTTAQLNWRALYDKSENLSLDWGERILSGVWSGQDLIVSGYPVLTKNQTGLFLTTGAGDARYIQYSETGAFASNVNLQTISGRVSSVSGTTQALSGQTQGLQGQINTINAKTGVFIASAQTGQFYPSSNPSGFITAAQAGGVQSLTVTGRAISGVITISSSGGVNLTSTGQTITINVSTGQFASAVNLATISGRVNSVSGTTQALSGQTQGLQTQITAINTKTGAFITTGAGDSRYIQYSETGAFASNINLQTVSGTTQGLQSQILALSGVTVFTTGDQIITGEKTFFVVHISGQNSRLTFGSGISGSTIQDTSNSLSISGPSANVGISEGNDLIFLGDGQTLGASGAGLLNVGFSGNTVNLNVSGVNYIFPVSTTGIFVSTGAGDIRYILRNESGQFASVVNLNSTGLILSGIDVGIQNQINTINAKTGAFLTSGAGDARYIQYTETGAFASNVNLQTVSGRVSAVSGALSGQTQGLQSQINTLNNKTGVFITDAETGDFVTTDDSRWLSFGNVSQTITSMIGGGQIICYPNVASWSRTTTNGALVFNTPLSRTNNRMFCINIKGYNYGTRKIHNILLGGYIYASISGSIDGLPGAIFKAAVSCLDMGNDGLQKCVGINKSGYLAISLGTTGSTFTYTHLTADVWASFNSPSVLKSKWSWSVETGENFEFLDIATGTTGQNFFYPSSNPSGYISFESGDTRYLQYIETGQFASSVNLSTISGRVDSVSGSAQALSGQTQGLQSQINTINAKTGTFITTAQTGSFGGAITWRVVTGLITGLASGDYVKIPSGKLYTPGAEELSIFVNGDLQYITDEYIEIDTSGISFLYNVPMDSKIIFNFIG